MITHCTSKDSHGLWGLYRSLWIHAKGRRGMVVLFTALLVVSQAIKLSIPYLFGQAVNAAQTQGMVGLSSAGWSMAMIFGACVLSWLLHGPGRVIERYTAMHIRESFTDALYAKTVSLPLRWHESHHSGETIERANKAGNALFSFAQNQFIYLENAVNLIGPLVALFFISTGTGAAAILGYVVIGFVLVRFDKRMISIIREQNQAERRYNAELVDCLGNITTVQTLRLQGPTRRAVAERLRTVFKPLRRSVVVNEAKWCAIDLLNNALRAGLVVIYAWLSYTYEGIFLLGTAVIVYQYAQQAGGVVSSMAGHYQDLIRYKTDFEGAKTIWEAQSRSRTNPVPTEWEDIRIEGLDFTYNGQRGRVTALHDLKLTLNRGSRIALIGESGSGKSTLLRLLAGLYQADRASFLVDGVDRPDLKDLGTIATLIPQDPEVFESSLGQNITLGVKYDPADVSRACDLACLSSVLEKLPNGLETDTAERGVNLSGGQKQRLALARGILAARDSSLIMMDEPTSSLDPATEAQVYDNLLEEFPDACVISSIHRLHLLPRFDTIVLMGEGRIIDSGTLAELYARQSRFRAMWHRYGGGEIKQDQPLAA